MAVIRITDCAFQPMIDRCILSVDVFTEDDSRTYCIIASSSDILTEASMRAYIEQNIELQHKALPDWTGSSWKSTRELTHAKSTA